jgi:hypothetical protein
MSLSEFLNLPQEQKTADKAVTLPVNDDGYTQGIRESAVKLIAGLQCSKPQQWYYGTQWSSGRCLWRSIHDQDATLIF